MPQQSAANWYADPTGRHQLRYWNGTAWTEHVSDAGTQSTDSREAPPKQRKTFKEAMQRADREHKAKIAEKQAERTANLDERVAAGARRDVEEARAKMTIKLGAGRELKKLPNHLFDDETVEVLTSGKYGESLGLLVLTDRRLMFLFEGLLNSRLEDFPIANISSISFKSGLLMSTIKVHASGNNAVIEQVSKVDAKTITDAVRDRLSRPVQAAPPAVLSAADELATWMGLLDSGVISAEDFTAKKAQLLDLLTNAVPKSCTWSSF